MDTDLGGLEIPTMVMEMGASWLVVYQRVCGLWFRMVRLGFFN